MMMPPLVVLMGLEKLSSNVWSHYLKIYVWLEGRALYRLRKEFCFHNFPLTKGKRVSMLVMDLAKNIRCIVKSQYKLKCHHPRAVFYGN